MRSFSLPGLRAFGLSIREQSTELARPRFSMVNAAVCFNALSELQGPCKPEAASMDVDLLSNILPTSQPLMDLIPETDVEPSWPHACPQAGQSRDRPRTSRAGSKETRRSFFSDGCPNMERADLPPNRADHDHHLANMKDLMEATWLCGLAPKASFEQHSLVFLAGS